MKSKKSPVVYQMRFSDLKKIIKEEIEALEGTPVPGADPTEDTPWEQAELADKEEHVPTKIQREAYIRKLRLKEAAMHRRLTQVREMLRRVTRR